MDHGSGRLKAVFDQADRILPATSSEGSTDIKEQLNVFSTDYDRLKSSVLEAKNDLETTLSQWSSFDYSCELLNQWIKEVEVKLRSDREPMNDLVEKRSCLEKVRMLAKDIDLHKPQLDKLEERCGVLQEPHASDMLTEVSQRFDGVQNLAGETLAHLEAEVADHEAYKTSYNDCLDWVTSTRQKLHQLADGSGNKEDVKERLKQLEVNNLIILKESACQSFPYKSHISMIYALRNLLLTVT